MNTPALAVGTVLALVVVARFRKTRLETKDWAYPALLATFPFYYFAFALRAGDFDALKIELGIGLGFMALAYVGYRLGDAKQLPLLAAGYIAHAAYDVVHESLFHNAGTPKWWPEFCGVIDALIGIYLVYLALSLLRRSPKGA